MLYLVDETFHQMSLPIDMLVVLAWLFAIAPRGHNNLCTTLFETFEEIFRIIAFVSQEELEVEVFDQRLGLRLIVTLTASQ